MSTIHSVVSYSLVFSTSLSFSFLYNKINCLPFWTLLCFIFPCLSLSELTLFLLLRLFSALRHHSLVHKCILISTLYIYAPTTTSNFDVLKIQRKRATHGFPFCASRNPQLMGRRTSIWKFIYAYKWVASRSPYSDEKTLIDAHKNKISPSGLIW